MISSDTYRRSALRRGLAIVGCALILVLGSAMDASAKSKAHLRVTKISNPPATLVAGSALKAVVTTRDAGMHVGKSRTVLYLSADRRLSASDVRLSGTGHVPALAPGKRARTTVRATVPRAAAAGGYYLLACAEAGSAGHGKAGNCGASARRLALVARPRPLTVLAKPDVTRSVGATIGPAGGKLQTTGADGTVYVLTVPAGALADDTPVTMTPLASFGGAPVTRPIGVQITPDGVAPLIAATLSIAPKAAVPAAKRAAFSFEGTGGEFHLQPSSVTEGDVTMRVARFGGYGVGLADLVARRRIAAQHPPTAVLDQLSQALAVGGSSATIARAAAAAGSAFPRDQLDALALATYYDIQSRLALGTASGIDSALSEYTAWSALVDGLGRRSPELLSDRENLRQQFVTAVARATTSARLSCEGGDLNALAELLSLRSINTALPGVALPESAISSAISACMRFSIDYEAEVNENEDDGDIAGDIVVDSDNNIVALQQDLGSSFLLQGSLPLTVTKYTFYDYVCDQQGGTATPQAPGSVTIRLTPGTPYAPYIPGHAAALDFPPPTLAVSFNHGSVETTNACGLDGFSGGLYDKELPRDFSDLYNTDISQFVLPDVQFLAARGQAFTVFNQTRPPTASTESTGRILIKLTHKPSP